MVHGQDEAAADIAKAGFAAVRDLDEERAALYSDIVLTSLGAARRVDRACGECEGCC
jgi:hypothetical protein